MRRLVPLLSLLAVTAAASAQSPPFEGSPPPPLPPGVIPLDSLIRVYDAEGRPSSLEAVWDAALGADVLLLGEQHDDSLAHVIEQRLLLISPSFGSARMRLGLEMVETDVQTVLDEYLAGLVREQDWLAAGRPWANYADYRPLIEHARLITGAFPVVATNAPGRYVSLVAREGAEALDGLSDAAKAWLPPLPVAPASEALAAKFAAAMGGVPHGSGPSVERMLAAQNLRDATMAWRIAETLRESPGAFVLHVNGSFHSEGRLGIPEHLARYAPDARVLTVTIRPAADPDAAPPPSGDDFVILTRVDS